VTKTNLIALLVAGAIAASAGAAHALHDASPSCPPRLPASDPSARPGSTETLVPAGPQSLLVCAYHGLNPRSLAGRLARSGSIGAGSELSTIVDEFDALHASVGLSGCPMDDGSTILAIFGYPQPPSSPATVAPTGCRIVGNGHLTRTASLAPGPTLIERLNSILR
jgi:hypothetical protein